VGREHAILPPDSSRPLAGDFQFDRQEYAFIQRVALSVSAGNGLMPVDGDDAETIALPTRWFARRGIAADLTVLVSVKGDSMAPGIPDGALVLLSVAEKLLIKQGIYAFNLDGQSYVKRILPSQVGPDGRPQALLLVSDNLAYPPIAVSGPDMNAITWIGRVRAVLTML
jgi:phage repressor protein C with HTH and peptisase S24 domain